MRTSITSTGVPVKNIELTNLDDGRQRLRIELGDDAGTVVEWYGLLEIEPQWPPSRDLPNTYDLTLAAIKGWPGDPWARLTVKPPYRVEDSVLLRYP